MGDITFDLSGSGAIDDLRAANRLHYAVTGLLLGDNINEGSLAELTGTLDLISSICIENIVYQQRSNQEEKTQGLTDIMNKFSEMNSIIDDKAFLEWFVSMMQDEQPFEKFTVKSLIDNIKFWHEAYLNNQG
ncbi:MAG: hypothetical protein KZQ64_07615 [gamma proteobacterium symbiont of Bathyaustriella thionipta]|nr:hypothetical protein [gamma proteobacterium symbiont of Bathyaustriella thionipta]MCU7950512.1 hypothetical protein [gamma proteobacterium symbiont of Bathyaustriella thionipta]MCU7953239.1 hypothetical protein [gamma proteobacterium symbiont of Bathyaustriella thionipta]MCU7957006.1 hypothetical protein [gamma proteobacterium symbiont of Bathyaustriella thionipta]MCU7965934.1 hypothetical protein [gamma proteobacterium symbiont of Bathyaustriella thionipta]